MDEVATTSSTREKQPQQWPVGRASDIACGEVSLVKVKNRSIGIFNVNGTFVAALNMCPHELAPVCRGQVRGTTLPSAPGEYRWGREGEILACPWHGWEYDLLTGKMLADERIRLRAYPVEVRDGTLYITL
jgi:nitrite reductase/ring-hydroxylating ferredoxin subunit